MLTGGSLIVLTWPANAVFSEGSASARDGTTGWRADGGARRAEAARTPLMPEAEGQWTRVDRGVSFLENDQVGALLLLAPCGSVTQ